VSGFADAALRAVARWKFEPGLKNGRHVRFRMSVPIMFRIDRL
jgi:outer membrane biosynthesis protein TonB